MINTRMRYNGTWRSCVSCMRATVVVSENWNRSEIKQFWAMCSSRTSFTIYIHIYSLVATYTYGQNDVRSDFSCSLRNNKSNIFKIGDVAQAVRQPGDPNCNLRLSIFFSFTSLSRLFQLIWDGLISRWGENGRTPRKTTWHTRKQNLACLTCGQSGARTQRWDESIFYLLKCW